MRKTLTLQARIDGQHNRTDVLEDEACQLAETQAAQHELVDDTEPDTIFYPLFVFHGKGTAKNA